MKIPPASRDNFPRISLRGNTLRRNPRHVGTKNSTEIVEIIFFGGKKEEQGRGTYCTKNRLYLVGMTEIFFHKPSHKKQKPQKKKEVDDGERPPFVMHQSDLSVKGVYVIVKR